MTLASVVVVGAAAAPPPPSPSSFFGRLTAGGQAVADGTVVSASVHGVTIAQAQTFTADGASVFRIDVPGDIPGTPDVEGATDGEAVDFAVDDSPIGTASAWSSGSYSRHDLAAPVGPDLAVILSDAVSSASPGQTLTYTLTVSNAGAASVQSVDLTVAIGEGAVFASASDAGSAAGGLVRWPMFSVPAAGSMTRSLTVRVGSSVAAGFEQLVTSATVRALGSGVDPVPSNNRASDTDAIDATPDLVVALAANVTEVLADSLFEYTVHVRNAGLQDASEVDLRAELPEWLALFVASDHGNAEAGVVRWPAISLAAGEEVVRVFKVRAPAALPPVDELSVTARADDDQRGGADPTPENRFAETRLPLRRLPDLTVAPVSTAGLTVDPVTLAIGGSLGTTVSNAGNSDAGPFRIVAFQDRDGDGRFAPGVDDLLGESSLALSSGSSSEVQISVAGTLLFTGNRLLIEVDPDDVVEESDESANVGSTASACGLVPQPGPFRPVLEWSWPVAGASIVAPRSVDTVSTPLVVPLTDDNHDGRFDENDTPSIVFVTADFDDVANVPRVVRAIRGDTGASLWDASDFGLQLSNGIYAFTLTGLAAGDLDRDGRIEILVSAARWDFGAGFGEPPRANHLFAYTATGVRKWVSDGFTTRSAGPSERDNPLIADLDRDGYPEVIVGANVFDGRNGHTKWKGTAGQAFQSEANDGSSEGGAISIVANLDLLGDPELVTGNTAYRADGSVDWQVPYPDGYPAVANFDADDYPEIVVVSHGTVRLHRYDGTLIWGPVTLPGTDPEAGGAPTIADFDGDGEPEIGVAGSDRYTVLEGDGSIRWVTQTQDRSSNMTGSTVFDFDGDGRFEVVYRDERQLRIYDGSDGRVRLDSPLYVSSLTETEEPVVADVDGDGRAEIIVAADRATAISMPLSDRSRGLKIYGADNWVSARRTWNQHAYSMTNIAGDGGVPREALPSWLEGNTFRAQAQPRHPVLGAPDLTTSRVAVDLSGYPSIRVSARIGNGGDLATQAGLPVAFRDGGPAGPTIAVVPLGRVLRPGEYADLSATWAAPAIATGQVTVVADDDGTGKGGERECDEGNNVAFASFDPAILGLTVAASDGRDAVAAGETVSYGIVAFNGRAEAANGVLLTAELPPNVSVVSTDGGSIDGAGVVTWAPLTLSGRSSITKTVTVTVDPDLPLDVTGLELRATVTDDGSNGTDPTPENNTAVDLDRVTSVRASAGGPYQVSEGVDLTLDASASVERDGAALTFAWDLDQDGAFDDANGSQATRRWPDEGTYVVAVRVTSANGDFGVDSATVTVGNATPVVDAGTDLDTTEGTSVELSAVFSDPGVGDLHTALVDWGDGSVVAVPVSEASGSGTVTGSHLYPDDGTYTARVCVSDLDGAKGCDEVSIRVANALPLVAEEPAVALGSWHVESYGAVAPKWTVSADGGSVTQSVNADPSVFVSDFDAFGSTIEGSIATLDTDDDFIGFALGYRPGDNVSSRAEWLLLDWKKTAQTAVRTNCFGTYTSKAGLALSRVSGVPTVDAFSGHFGSACQGGSVEEIARGASRGAIGWVRGTAYRFRFETSTTRLRIYVNGTLEFDVPGPFPPGRLAFYNFSQAATTYSGYTATGVAGEEGAPVLVDAKFTDAGVLDRHTSRFAWGDGTTTTASVVEPAGSAPGRFSESHTYAEQGFYDLDVCATDGDGEGCTSIPVTIVNVAPTVDAGPDRLAYLGESFTLEAPFSDPGVLDRHFATLSWGDGTATVTPSLSESAGSGVVSASHLFRMGGGFDTKVCVRDDDGGSRCDSVRVLALSPRLDLGVTLESDRRVARPSERINWTLTLANNGTREPQNVVLTDVVPSPLLFVSASDGGTYDAATRTVRWTVPLVSYGSTMTRTLVLQAPPAPVFGTVVENRAAVTDDGRYGADLNPADNVAIAPVKLWDAVTPIVDPGSGSRSAVEGRVVEVEAGFADTLANEAHTSRAIWGDGETTPEFALIQSGLTGTVYARHAYRDEGTYDAQLCVTDAAGHEGCEPISVTVSNAPPHVVDDASLDLASWLVERAREPAGDALWTVSTNGKSVTQGTNSGTSWDLSPISLFSNRLEVVVRATAGSFVDDDAIGLALGAGPGDLLGVDGSYLLLDWRRGTQATTACGLGTVDARLGLALSLVTPHAMSDELRSHVDSPCNGTGNGVRELARGRTRGATGWAYATDYRIHAQATTTRIQIWVNGTLEFDVSGDFGNGRIGVYTHSQAGVTFTPSLSPILPSSGIEGSTATLRATVEDDGVRDVITGTVEWGDGTQSPFSPQPGRSAHEITAGHVYGDQGTYPVKVCAQDEDGGADCGTYTMQIANAAPSVDAGPDQNVYVGEPLALTASFRDPGFLDTHTVVVAWGDGSTSPGTVTESNGEGTVVATHAWETQGSRTVQVCAYDDEGASGCDSVTIAVRAAPRLHVTKTDSLAVDGEPAGVASQGDEVEYTIAVEVLPGSAASFVVLRDAIPAPATLVPESIATTRGAITSSEPIEIALGALAVGESATVRFRVRLPSEVDPSITELRNQATVSLGGVSTPVLSDDPDQPGSEDPTVTPVVAGKPELAATKTAVLEVDADGDGVPSPGDTLRYTIEVRNRGNVAATDVALDDPLPVTAVIVAGSSSSSRGEVTEGSTVHAALGVLAPEEVATVAFSVRLARPLPAGTTVVTNQASVTSAEVPAVLSDDPEVAGDADPTVTTVVARPRLTASLSAELGVDADGDGSPSPGDTLHYRLVVTNLGNAPASELRVDLDGPDHAAVVEGSVNTTYGNLVNIAPLALDLGSLDVDEETVVTFGARVENPVSSGVRSVTAQATIASAELPSLASDDPDQDGPADPTVTAITASPELHLVKAAVLQEDRDGDGAVSPGDVLLYRLTLSNTGNSGASLVSLTDPLPELVTLVPGSVQASVGAVAPDGVGISLDEMPAGSELVASFLAEIAPDFPVDRLAVVNAAVATSRETGELASDDPATPELGDPTVTEVFITPTLNTADVEVSESGGAASVRFELSRPSNRGVRADWETTEGSARAGLDYSTSSGTLVIPPGELAATVMVPILDDTLDEIDETFAVAPSTPQGATLGTPLATVRVLDDDAAPLLSVQDTSVVEGTGTDTEATFRLVLSAPSALDVEVDVATADGNANEGSDYTAVARAVVLPAGSTVGVVRVPVAGDALDEDDETFRLLLTEVRNATRVRDEAVATIIDDDVVTLTLRGARVREGDSGTTPLVFSVELSSPSTRPLAVDFRTVPGTATEGSDYLAVSGTLTMAPGDDRASIAVPVVGDTILEPEIETLTLELSNPVGVTLANDSAPGRIEDDERCESPNLLLNGGGETSSSGELVGWREVLGTTWVRRADGGAYDGNACIVPGAVGAGELAQDVDLRAYAGELDGGELRFVARAAIRTAAETPPDVGRIVVEYRDAAGIVLDAWDSGERATAGSWDVASDERTVPVGTRSARVRLLASRFAGPTLDACFDAVELHSLRVPVVTIGDVSVYEGDSGTTPARFPIALSCALDRPVTVGYATANGTALAGSDYQATSGALTLTPSVATALVPVPVFGDTVREPHETFDLRIAPQGAVSPDPTGTALIVDDDFCARSHGYWKTHRSLWPTDHLTIGALEYDATGMMAFLSYRGSDMTGILALQLVATELNLLAGSDPVILPTEARAQAYLTAYPPGSNPKGAARSEGETIKNALDAYNNSACSPNAVFP